MAASQPIKYTQCSYGLLEKSITWSALPFYFREIPFLEYLMKYYDFSMDFAVTSARKHYLDIITQFRRINGSNHIHVFCLSDEVLASICIEHLVIGFRVVHVFLLIEPILVPTEPFVLRLKDFPELIR
jgi:hypothetical protein